MLRIITGLIIQVLIAVPTYADPLGISPDEPFVKCGTYAAMQQRMTMGNATMSSSRYYLGTNIDGLLPVQAVSGEGHFRAHYDSIGYHAPSQNDLDANGIPDYVDSTLVYLEYAWGIIIDDLGYDTPAPDGGRGNGDEVDVYIMNLNGYGLTMPETSTGSAPSYMIIDNDFYGPQYATKGYDALRVTTAHEFFHVIHFTYFVDMTMHWWMEHSAVWMEDYAWDDVNDYLAYLHYFFEQKLTSLDNNDDWNNYMYGAAIWPMYLEKRFDSDLIRQIWEEARTSGTHRISSLDAVIPGGIAAAVNEFAVWNYFVGPRANTTDFHHDADLFFVNDVVDAIYQDDPAEDAMNANALTSRYAEFRFVGDAPETALSVHLMPRDGAVFAASLILYNTPDDYLIEPLQTGDTIVPLEKAWDRAVLVTSCTSLYGTDFWFDFGGRMAEITLADEEVPESFSIGAPFPNPFNPATTIGFTLPEAGNVRITAYNVQGQEVELLARDRFSAGQHHILWHPDNLAGGLYFIRIDTPTGTLTAKTLYMK